MKIAVAQIRSARGDMAAAISTHKSMIEKAVSLAADAVFFPELSLTGYEPAFAKEAVANHDDQMLDDFQEISDRNGITIGVGMPTKADSGIRISMMIFQPGSPRRMYSKQQLHPDEFPYFTHGNSQTLLTVGGERIAPAICYESLQNDHSENAHRLGAEIYVASVAKSQTGVDKAMMHYPDVAKRFSMAVLMPNCIGPCDTFQSVGQSAVWTKRGELLARLDGASEGLLVFDTETEEVIVQTVSLFPQ